MPFFLFLNKNYIKKRKIDKVLCKHVKGHKKTKTELFSYTN